MPGAVSRMAIWNSLAQTAIRLTAPGIPDTYQGDELWDLSLVDPDNRRPVDYGERRNVLKQVQEGFGGPDRTQFLQTLLQQPETGAIKMHLLTRALHARRQRPELFSRGEYIPLP